MDFKRKYSFFDNYSGEFFEHISYSEERLERENISYQRLCSEETKILKKYPRVRYFIEDNKNIFLSKIEQKKLRRILDIRDIKDDYIWKEMFYVGIREAYFIFKKCQLLRDENDVYPDGVKYEKEYR